MHEMNLQATDAFTPRLAAAASLDELRELCRVHSDALGFQHFFTRCAFRPTFQMRA